MFRAIFAEYRLSCWFMCACLVCLPSLVSADPIDITRASVSDVEDEAEGNSMDADVSGDGNTVAFASDAEDVISGDTNDVMDVFVRDRTAGSTSRVSVADMGGQANGASGKPAIDLDGSSTAFESEATNLIANDSNDVKDIYVRDTDLGTTTRVSVHSNTIEGDAASEAPSIGADGSCVAFESDATNLVISDTNLSRDVFVHDLGAGMTERASVDSSENQSDGDSAGASIGSDCSCVAFHSIATDLINNDNNEVSDVFFRDLVAGQTERVSEDSSGNEADGASSNPAASSDCDIIAFQSDATDLVSDDGNEFTDIFVYDMTNGVTTRISEDLGNDDGNGNSVWPAVSDDGRFVAFLSDATDLVANDSNNTAADGMYDVFLHDRMMGTTTRINTEVTGSQVEGNSVDLAVDADGTVSVFTSASDELVPNDLNASNDVFVVDSDCPTDSDGDATVNCTDECPFDSGKILVGTCGCGVADTDTDGDATPDCNDECDSDAAKAEEGACGCGVADVDANGNGQFDCLDPDADTVPKRPRVRRGNGSALVRIPKDFVGATYDIKVRGAGRTLGRKSTSRFRARFRGLPSGQTLSARYTATLGNTTTKQSKKKKFRLR